MTTSIKPLTRLRAFLAKAGLVSLSLLVILPAIAFAQITYNNSASISIPANGNATPNTSTINVSGAGTVVTGVTVSLNNISHPRPDDLDILLTGPGGTVRVALTQDSGGTTAISGQTWTFSDGAAAPIADGGPVATGTFMPSDGDGAGLGNNPAPAPQGGYTSRLSSFIGANPNGVWSLYVTDDQAGPGTTTGSIGGGWSLTIRTGTVQTNAANITVPAQAPARRPVHLIHRL